MKFKALLSILFVIATSFSAIHEINHIYNQDTVDCELCQVNDNLVFADIIDKVIDVEIFHFNKIVKNDFIETLYSKKSTNQTRAPPHIS